MNKLVLDIETTDLDPFKGELVLVGFKLNGGEYEAFRPIDGEQAPEHFKKALSDSSCVKCGHSILFDIFFLKVKGYEIGPNFEDSRLLAYLDNPYQDCRLKPLMKSRYNKDVVEFKDLTGKGKKKLSTEAIDNNTLVMYNKNDVEYTDKLSNDLPANPWYRNVEVPLMSIIYKAKEMGLLIDRPHLERLQGQLVPEIEKLRGTFGETNPNSYKQVLELYSKLGIDTSKYSEDGKPCTDVTTRKRIAWDIGDEMSINLSRYKKLSIAHKNYVYKLLNMSAKTSYIHGSFNQAGSSSSSSGTRTGRLSSTDPNLQQIPSRNELGKEIRKAFIPRSGYKMFVYDLKQIEPRVLTHYSQSETLKRAFSEGLDTHKLMAASIFSKPVSEVNDRERFIGKTAWLEIVYGAYEKRIKWSIEKDSEEDPNISIEECKQIRQSFWQNNYEIKSWRDRHIARTRSIGQIVTFGGRKVSIPNLFSNNIREVNAAERQCVSYLIQGSAADIMKLITLKLDEEFGSLVRQLAWVHDEILGEIPNDYANDFFMQRVKNVIENTCKLDGLKIEADGGLINNWGEK